MLLIFNYIVLTLNKFCKWNVTLPCVCKPQNKKFCGFQKEIPTKVINSLKDLTDLQLNYIGLMFK